MRPLTTEEEFAQAESSRAHVLIRDSANGRTLHRLPCRYVKLHNFVEKVIVNKGRNGSYTVIEAGDYAESDPSIRRCSACDSRSAVSSAPVVLSAQHESSPSDPRRSAPSGDGPSGAALRWLGGARDAFEAWCSRQIDLESKPPDSRGSVRELIREGLRDLRPTPNALLRASYRAADLLQGSDVENLLFTNVDATGSIFRALVVDGLEFDLTEGDPSADAPKEGLAFCSTYSWISRAQSDRDWASLKSLAAWSEVAVPGLGQVSRAPALWWILRRAPIRLDRSAVAPPRFGVDLRVQVPPGLAFNAASRVKPAIDAAVLCLSADDGRSTEEGIAAMAVHAGAPADAVGALLRDDSIALLGRHRLVDRRGQVSPPDHGCVRGRVVVDPSADDQWRLSVRVVALG